MVRLACSTAIVWLLVHSETYTMAAETIRNSQEQDMSLVSSEAGQQNRLAQEKSPYLLQHADNPVDWYPWGAEAFEKARVEEKPIFLSIGYSTCHWCHVMAHESFENPQIAAIMNEHFVNIKVDREERPDVDSIYMTAVQAMTGQGGWPLSVFLTPDRQPFYGGTYFPPEDRWGRPGFSRLLESIADTWDRRQADAVQTAERLTEALRASSMASGSDAAVLDAAVLDQANHRFQQMFDTRWGGFGQAPKFPQPQSLAFLLRYAHRTGNAQALNMVRITLDRMAEGGMYDHLGGGFHRYSTDERWLVPHFEKMLYDQAGLVRAYAETYQVTGETHYARVVRETCDYVLRDLTDTSGGFLSAEDADSEGEEGTFYVWTPEQIEGVLGAARASRFSEYYGVTLQGNFEHETSILHVAQSLQDVAEAHGVSVETLGDELAGSRAELMAVREQRIRPHRDDKVLTAWNGLMIGAMSTAARILNEPRYLDAAQRAAAAVLTHLQRDGRLLRRYRDGEGAIPAYLDDYAFLIWGLHDLYEADFNPRWLAEASRLTDQMIELFWDEEQHGFFFSGHDGEALIVRTKELHDAAIPSGNSVAFLDLVRLGHLTGNTRWQQLAEQMQQTFGGQVQQLPVGYAQFLIGLDFAIGPLQEIVFAGSSDDENMRSMQAVLRQHFLPRALSALHPNTNGEAIEELVPFLKAQTALDGHSTAYVCENYACQLPVTTPKALSEQLIRLNSSL